MQLTNNSTAFIEAQQYSQFILLNLKDGLLPDNFVRDVSDFGTGTTLNIKNIGAAQVQDVEENVPLIYNPIDTGNITLSITDYVGDAWYVTDVLRQDGAQIEALMAARSQESTRALQEYYETRFLAVSNAGQTAANPNNINGFSHRFLASGTNEQMTEADFIDMGLAFNKANVPMAGRIAIVDPVVAATLNKLTTMTVSLDRDPFFTQVFHEGFEQEHKFIGNIYGWNIFTSNRLADLAAGTDVDGTDSVTTAGKANVFMSVLDDQTKPVMAAWRQMPAAEGERNKDNARDEFVVRARFGFGVQRLDGLGIVVCDAAATA